jgi:hypothetical protein
VAAVQLGAAAKAGVAATKKLAEASSAVTVRFTWALQPRRYAVRCSRLPCNAEGLRRFYV